MIHAHIGGLALIALAAVLTDNILLSKFLGMCSFIALSRTMKTAAGMGVAVTFTTFFTAIINYGIYHGVLVANAPLCPADLTYLTFMVFIMVIAGFVQLVEMIVERFSPLLYRNLGIYLPLITVNCAILGVNLFMIDPAHKFNMAQTAAFGLGSGAGWMLAIILLAGIRIRLAQSDIPRPLVGLGITMIVTGLMAMAFMGFSGIGNL